MRLIASVLCVFAAIFLCWYGGADFLHRSFYNAMMLVFCFASGVFAYACPVWWKKSNT